MPIRLVAVDLDGTLVNDELKINERDIAAVKAATAAGVHVVIATGRMFRSSLPYARTVGLTGPIINYQGAVVRDISNEEVIYKCELTVEMQKRVLAFVEPRDWHVNAYVEEKVYTERARPEADLYERISGVPYEAVGRLSSWVKRDSTKMVLVDLDKESVPERMAELSRWMGSVARVTRSLAWFMEVINPQVSKARALALVAERLGVARADVCAIGDNKNDEEMISWAGLGVAMGDAPPEVKEIAGYVTRTVNEAGVADVLERFVLGRETARA